MNTYGGLYMKRCLVIVLIVITLLFSSCSIPFAENNVLKIGIAGIEDTEKCITYIKQQTGFENLNIEFIDLGDGSGDVFENVFNNINSYIKSQKIDMIIGVPEDYILSQNDDLFLDLSDLLSINLLPAVYNHLKEIKSTKISFMPHTFYCTRFLIENENFFKDIGYTAPDKYNNISEVVETAKNIDALIPLSEKNKFAISFGSPNNEFLYDDIANLLLFTNYPRTESDIQQRFYDSEYINLYKSLYKCAIDLSYNRDDIGYEYPLDYYFSTGNVAMKIATTNELYGFNNIQENTPFKSYIDSFEFKVANVSTVLSTQSTVIAISAYSNKSEICKSLLKFFLTEKYGIDILQNNSPFLIDMRSLPCITSTDIEKNIYQMYKIISLNHYSDYTTFSFVKNSNTHWGIIDKERSIFEKNIGGDFKSLYEQLKTISLN